MQILYFYNCFKGMSEVAKCSQVTGPIECVKPKDTTRCTIGSNDFDIFLYIQHASWVFGVGLKS